ncbi:MAG TPA: TetR/AcrR family transcriptional regulator [Weissella thailandensis]|uniref:TetR/AcrR family transcriptional regulator n=1 Tax=Weissella thailandensis TaxID=89061 RepID=UPI001DF86D90|nr:TetR/AcrR family transcriptional regulator [Weissella thailandensis]HJG83832.1 TetR/AcrR family transcriptional regulator [Weissella thailandensis]
MKKAEITHRKILTIAEELFTTHELNKVTVEQISKLSHINRSTFYRHFPSYEDLIIELVQEKITIINRPLNINPYNEFLVLLQVIEDNFLLFQHIITQLDQFHYRFQQLLSERLHEIQLTEFTNSNINNPADAELFYNVVIAIFSSWLLSPDTINKQDVKNFVSKHFFNY